MNRQRQTEYILVPVVFVIIAMVYLALNYRSSFMFGMTADSAVYLMMADSFSPYYAADTGLYTWLLSEYPFPPMFPLVLGFTGGGSMAPLPSYLVSTFMLLVALWFLYLWGRQVLGSGLAPLMAVMIFALLPGTLNQLMVIQSEHLYLALVLAGFFLLQHEHYKGRTYTIVLMFGLAAITRTIGVLAILALMLHLWRRNGLLKTIMPALVSILPLAIWSGYKFLYVESEGYISIFSAGMHGDFLSNILTQFDVNTRLMWLYWVRGFDVALSPYSFSAVAIVSLLMLYGFLVRLVRRHPDAIYMCGYLLILLVWPYPAQLERFIFILMPFAIIYGLYALLHIQAWLGSKVIHIAVPAYGLAMLLVMAPTLAVMWSRYISADGINPEQMRSIQWLQAPDTGKVVSSQHTMQRIYRFMQRARYQVPRDDCILSTTPAYLMLHSGRMSRKPSPHGSSDYDFRMGQVECDYVLMIAAVPRPNVGNPAMYPYERIKDRMRVIDVMYDRPGDDASHVLAMLSKYEG